MVGIPEDVERDARKEKRKMLPREGDVRTHCVEYCGETKCSGLKGGERTKRQEPIASGGWTGGWKKTDLSTLRRTLWLSATNGQRR